MPENPPAQNPNENTKPEKKKSKKIWLVIIIAIILLIAAGLLIYLFLPASESKTDTKDSGTPTASEATPSATPSEEVYECSGQVYENSEQGYKVCFEEGWVNRVFGAGTTTVGFDPTNIPEASEYAGLIVVSVSSSDIASARSEIEAALETPSTTTTTVDGAAATQISGTEPANMVNSGGPIIKTLFTHFDRLYVVTLSNNTTENKVFYDDFLSSWRFLDVASAPAP